LRELIDTGCEFIATSVYTAADLTAIRPEVEYRVVPPYNQVDDLLRATPDYLAALPYNDARHNVLTVGRLVPNKNLVRGVEAFARFHASVRGRARLLVVGDPGDGRYARQVTAAATRAGIGGDVAIVGKVGVRQLKALYLIADALLLVSEHEGFGVPLVEAMALRVPAVASSTTALPETGGDAAVYADPTDDKAIAAALKDVVCNLDLRETLMTRGRERYETRFANHRIDQATAELVGSAIGGLTPCRESALSVRA
jgi:glycosyltransferase involved in cell wall biosynthesis